MSHVHGSIQMNEFNLIRGRPVFQYVLHTFVFKVDHVLFIQQPEYFLSDIVQCTAALKSGYNV